MAFDECNLTSYLKKCQAEFKDGLCNVSMVKLYYSLYIL